MKYEQFSEIWDEAHAKFPDRPITEGTLLMDGMTKETQDALIAYANGDKSAIDDVKKRLVEAKRNAGRRSNIQNVTGDLLTYSGLEVICHQANCQNTMGSGIAKFIREKYPEAYAADSKAKLLDKNKLGEISIAVVKNKDRETSKIIINIYGQNLYGRESRKTNYEAVYVGLEKVKQFCTINGIKKLGFPYKMGCVLGGGDWNIVNAMIESVFSDYDGEVYIVELVV